MPAHLPSSSRVLNMPPTRPAAAHVGSPDPGPAPVVPAGSAVRTAFRQADGRITWDLSPPALTDALRRSEQGDGVLWLDICGTGAAPRDLLSRELGFHPLAVEDAVSPDTRVKIEEYGDRYLLIVLRTVRFCAETEDPYDVETANLALFVGRGYLVTVHAERSSSVDAVLELVRRSPDLLARGAARLAHMVADYSVDEFFPILDQIDDFVSGLEERVFERFDQSALQEIFRVKRLVLSLRRYLAPQRDVLNALSNRPLALVPAEGQVYFRDVYDHVLRINDSLEVFRDLLGGTLDSYLTQLSNRLGQVTKGLSVVATVSIPFVVISGMWGMNVSDIPLSRHPHAFALMLLIQLGVGAALAAVLRWRGML